MAKKKEIKFPLEVRDGSASGKIGRYERDDPPLANGKPRVFFVAWSGKWHFQDKSFDVVDAELRLYLAKVSAGQVAAAGMTREDRAELQAVRAIAGETPPTVALKEWKHEQERQRSARLGCTPMTVEDCINKFIAEGESAGGQHERTYRPKLSSLLLPTLTNPESPKNKMLRLPAPDSLAGRNIHSVSRDELQARLLKYSDYRTRNDYRKKAVALWRWAREAGHIPQDAALAIERTKRSKEAPALIGICTPMAYAQLLMYLQDYHPHFLAAAVLAGHEGLRCDEIHGKRGKQKADDTLLRQRWEDIHFAPERPDERPHLRVTCAKINTPSWRTVPLTAAAIAWLETVPVEKRKGYVCGKFALDRIRAIGKNRKLELADNCFRRGHISFRAELEGDKARIATDCGTSVQKIDSNYRRPVSRADAMEWTRLTPAHCRANYEALKQPTNSDAGKIGGLSRSPAKLAAVSRNLTGWRAKHLAKDDEAAAG